MGKLMDTPRRFVGELFRASRMGALRTLASVGTVVVMAPLLLIALFPLAVLSVVMVPPVGLWMLANSLCSDSL